MRHAARCVVFDRPDDSDDYGDALSEALLGVPRGMMLVYRINRSQDTPPDGLDRAAHEVGERKGFALVQWPNGSSACLYRTWCFAIQTPGRLA